MLKTLPFSNSLFESVSKERKKYGRSMLNIRLATIAYGLMVRIPCHIWKVKYALL